MLKYKKKNIEKRKEKKKKHGIKNFLNISKNA